MSGCGNNRDRAVKSQLIELFGVSTHATIINNSLEFNNVAIIFHTSELKSAINSIVRLVLGNGVLSGVGDAGFNRT